MVSSSHLGQSTIIGQIEKMAITSLSVLLCVLIFVNSTEALPLSLNQRQMSPRDFWTNPCGASGFNFFEGQTPNWQKLKGLLTEISERADMSSREAQQKKTQFLEGSYNDSAYESIYESIHHDWLPRCPPTKFLQADFETTNVETAFRKVYGYLQHYAVGLEQATLDQMFTYDGKFANLFMEIQNSLKQLLCDFDLSVSLLRIPKDPDVLRDVMSKEQRSISNEHEIMLRDYIILRDYIEMTSYISKLFGYLSGHPDKMPKNVRDISVMD